VKKDPHSELIELVLAQFKSSSFKSHLGRFPYIVMQSVTHTVNCNWYWPAAAEGYERNTSTQRSLYPH